MRDIDARIDNRDRDAASIENVRRCYQCAGQCACLLARGGCAGRCFYVTKRGYWPIW